MSKKQMGFTLIEIVMVLVLLGILSAVAVPKYFDLRDQAELQAAKATVAEFQARMNARFASELLKGATCAASRTTAITDTIGDTDFGDWSIESPKAAPAAEAVNMAITVKNKTSEKVYPTAVTGASDKTKADFTIVLPKCN